MIKMHRHKKSLNPNKTKEGLPNLASYSFGESFALHLIRSMQLNTHQDFPNKEYGLWSFHMRDKIGHVESNVDPFNGLPQNVHQHPYHGTTGLLLYPFAKTQSQK